MLKAAHNNFGGDDTMDTGFENTDSDDMENPADEVDGEKSLISANC